MTDRTLTAIAQHGEPFSYETELNWEQGDTRFYRGRVIFLNVVILSDDAIIASNPNEALATLKSMFAHSLGRALGERYDY